MCASDDEQQSLCKCVSDAKTCVWQKVPHCGKITSATKKTKLHKWEHTYNGEVIWSIYLKECRAHQLTSQLQLFFAFFMLPARVKPKSTHSHIQSVHFSLRARTHSHRNTIVAHYHSRQRSTFYKKKNFFIRHFDRNWSARIITVLTR